MQDLNDKITGGTLTAAEWNEIPSEIQNVIIGQGIALSSGNLNQLGKAIAGIVANGTFYKDSGAVNAYILTKVGNRQAAPEYTDGFEIAFIANSTNTAAATVNADGIGVKDLRTALGAVLPATALFTNVQGLDNVFRYNSAAGHFRQKVSKSTDANGDLSNLSNAGNEKIAKVWINFDGTGTIAIRDSFNVSSIVDNGVGSYDVTFPALPNLNYAAFAGGSDFLASVATKSVVVATHSYATTSISIETASGLLQVDWERVTLLIFGGA